MLKHLLLCILGISLGGNLAARTRVLNETLEITPEAGDAFQWPFLLHIPNDDPSPTLMVLPNNTGTVDDNFQPFVDNARRYMYRDAGYIAHKLRTPILIPIFPRPKLDPRLYTHALNRRALEIKDEKLARLDLQLIAMIDKARGILATKNIEVPEKVFMLGFSAAGMFANRFALLHPKRIRKVAFGSPGGWPLAPLAAWEGKSLRYPVGVADLGKLIGVPFDEAGFRQMELFYFQGSNDLNDSVIFRDSFDKEDEDLIRHWGTIPANRWETSLAMYKQAGCQCKFQLYPGLGHEMDDRVWNDVIDFFKERRIKP